MTAVFEDRFNYFFERAAISAICLWGNWAAYYWVAVLCFDASYTDLKDFLPVLFLQVALSLLYLLRLNLRIPSASYRTCTPVKRQATRSVGLSFPIVAVAMTAIALAIVLLVDHQGWSRSTISYNLLWVISLPVSLALLFYSKVASEDSGISVVAEKALSGRRAADCLLFLVSTLTMAFIAYGTGFPTPDDAFYGHVISSTLANPDLPVQGQDLLLGTSAPYSLHPAYRPVGFEILVALLSDLTGTSPLHVYFDIMPMVGSILWSLTAYLFMRALPSPYPGLAVAVCTIVFLLLSGVNRQASAFIFLHLGKSFAMIIAAPLLYFSVATFARSRDMGAWLLLLLSVFSVAAWSSSSVFLVPVCVGLASIVFVRKVKMDLPVFILISLTLIPVVLLLAYSFAMLNVAPVTASGYISTKFLRINGQSWGGLPVKSMFLFMLLVIPLISRTIPSAQFQTTVFRICLLGVFTIMAPYFVEAITVLSGLNLLADRLPSTFPAVLLTGVAASMAAVHLLPQESMSRLKGGIYLASVFVLIFFGFWYGLKSSIYAPKWQYAKAIYEAQFREAEAMKKLMPAASLVVSGRSDDALPIFPDPPSFVWVRHYLGFHKYFLTESEFDNREYLYTALKDLRAAKGDSVESTLDSIVSISEKLGVDALVFSVAAHEIASETKTQREEFAALLTRHLQLAGYTCVTTPSGGTRVCTE